jgi:hypothetical protein
MATELSTKTLTYVGSICVDSGQVIIGDPCYIKSNFDTDYDDPNPPELSYGSASQMTLSEKGMGTIGLVGDSGYGLAFASQTAYGDGVYAVYKVENGSEFVGLYLEFEPDGSLFDGEDE